MRKTFAINRAKETKFISIMKQDKLIAIPEADGNGGIRLCVYNEFSQRLGFINSVNGGMTWILEALDKSGLAITVEGLLENWVFVEVAPRIC